MEKQTIFLIGIGMGNRDTLTIGAWKALQSCDCIIGAQRMTDAFSDLVCFKYPRVVPKEIVSCIEEHPEYQKIGVLFSGDIGFYSGAKKLRPLLQEREYCIEEIPGISTLPYFCAKIYTSYEDIHLVSAHGRKVNPVGQVQSHAKTFFLVGIPGVQEICRVLCEAGFEKLSVSVGENLSYPNERIVSGTVLELSQMEFSSLSVMLVYNSTPVQPRAFGMADSLFLRGAVPMTKSEVRCISLSKLGIKPEDVVYDVGAGTGSVSVELAFSAYRGTVYAVEKEEEALQLIAQNRDKFHLHNLRLINGTAPDSLISLPPPDGVFIGGSSGRIEDIIRLILQKNSSVRMVVNAITLESVTRTVHTFETLGLKNIELIQVGITKAKQAGKSHMMLAENPVYIISAQGVKI